MKFLFDLGGVFFDWDPHYFYKDVFKKYKHYKNLAKKLGYRVRTNFSFEAMVMKLENILKIKNFPY